MIAETRLDRFNPLSRILFFDDFDEGINGWCELLGNHDNNLDNVKVRTRDPRPAQLSSCSFFDIGTHGSVDGVYALKLATRPRPFHMAQLIKRMTYVKRGPVQLESYLTYKAEAVLDDSIQTPRQWDGNTHPVESMFGEFTISNDVNDGPDGERHHGVLRYVNADRQGNLVHKWMYKTSLQVTTRMQLQGVPAPEDWHTVSPDDWEEIPGGHFSLCLNEVPTKINWHYLRWKFDTETRRHVDLQVNDRVMDLREIPVPVYPDTYHSCDRLLNFIFDVRTYMPVRNFLFLDSVLVSVDW